MTTRSQSVRRARGQGRSSVRGFIVTWDVDSRDASVNARLSRFIFGYETRKRGRVYRYPGLAGHEGVRYLGQSVVFVTLAVLPVLEASLTYNRVEYVVTAAGIGPILPSRAERSKMVTEAVAPSLATAVALA